MKFRCKESHSEDGAFWLAGEVYEFARNDLLKPDVATFLTHFEPVNEAAQAFVDSLEA